MKEKLTVDRPNKKDEIAMSPQLEQAIAEADRVYRAAHRPLYDEYVAALKPSDGFIHAVKTVYRPQFEALITARTLAIKAAFEAENQT